MLGSSYQFSTSANPRCSWGPEGSRLILDLSGFKSLVQAARHEKTVEQMEDMNMNLTDDQKMLFKIDVGMLFGIWGSNKYD